MGIQIFGTNKCKNTQKALRFFKERNIVIQFIDLTQKAISKGELNSIEKSIKPDNLIDRESREYKNKNLAHMSFNIDEILLENPLLFKTPIIRSGDKAYNGSETSEWKKFL